MKINLKELPQGKKDLHFTLGPGDIGIKEHEKDFELVSDVNTDVKLLKSRTTVNIDIEIEYTVKLQCSRCLDLFERTYHERESFVFKEGEEKLRKEKSLAEEDIYTYFYATEEIDISPLIRDMIILSIPMKPLCKPDCKGLCPVCGANWNRETCEHIGKIKPVTKLSKLLEFKNKLGK